MQSTATTNRLCSIEEATAIIESGAVAMVAGTESLLRRLPAGDWIGGTMRYFMTAEGGIQATDRVFVTVLPVDPSGVRIRSYGADELHEIASDAPGNGFSLIVIPAESPAHLAYAARAPYYPNLFQTPIVGWISGVRLKDLGRVLPRVFDGRRAQRETNRAVVVHAALPPGRVAQVETVNIFRGGTGDVITFAKDGLSATDCQVNGEARDLARYLAEVGADTRLPLVADYAGVAVNTSIRAVDAAAGVVTFYAPVFRGIEYRLAAPIDDYAEAFARAVEGVHLQPTFACNCILNYVYGELEGKAIEQLAGPMTFGEIAYQLMNQTVVYLSILDA